MSSAAVVTIRAAERADCAAIAAIFSAAIAERASTFDTEPVSADAAAAWLGREHEPLLVAERDGAVTGFARLIRSSERCALSGVGEYAIYLAPAARGAGIGTRLLGRLLAEAPAAGYWKLQGRMFSTNAGSLALARRCGFRVAGTYERHGRVDGVWRDLVIVERSL